MHYFLEYALIVLQRDLNAHSSLNMTDFLKTDTPNASRPVEQQKIHI